VLDIKALLSEPEEFARRLSRRGYELPLARLRELDERRRGLITELEEVRAESNRIGSRPPAGGGGGVATEVRERARELKERERGLEEQLRPAEGELRDLLLDIPNPPDDDLPDGGEEDAREISRWGEPPEFGFRVQDHVEIGERLGLIDFKAATALSGSRFAVLHGLGSRLERALINYFLDFHTREHGYRETSTPFLVTRETMTGTGQLPKFEEDLFGTGAGDRELFLIPTGEVPLTNLGATLVRTEADLPLALCGVTPCFRSEAGSHGRDTRGMLRQHQFIKVELVRFGRAGEGRQELEILRSHAEACLRPLDLHYRVVALAAGDVGFAAAFTYDLEVWLPGQERYREISSCSNCGDFQARRAGIRYKREKGRAFPDTLNGSGLPIGRTLIALLEQHQREDGGVDLPAALHPYAGFKGIAPDGAPEH
jgi:seryl-tRNA synthetase